MCTKTVSVLEARWTSHRTRGRPKNTNVMETKPRQRCTGQRDDDVWSVVCAPLGASARTPKLCDDQVNGQIEKKSLNKQGVFKQQLQLP